MRRQQQQLLTAGWRTHAGTCISSPPGDAVTVQLHSPLPIEWKPCRGHREAHRAHTTSTWAASWHSTCANTQQYHHPLKSRKAGEAPTPCKLFYKSMSRLPITCSCSSSSYNYSSASKVCRAWGRQAGTERGGSCLQLHMQNAVNLLY